MLCEEDNWMWLFFVIGWLFFVYLIFGGGFFVILIFMVILLLFEIWKGFFKCFLKEGMI